MLIGAVLAISLCALAVAAYAMTRTQGSESSEPKAAVAEKPIFLNLEPITVNLQTEGRPRFLHVGISLKVRDEKSKSQISEFMPELRSRTLMLLSNRQSDSLQTTDDKSRLAGEIQAELNRPLNDSLPPQGVTGVSFTAFVVQ
ncbi:flagellar FliL protein [Variovorax sp. OV329]|nr:flagellar FliL protein [Variovorax sp. OV329]